MSTQFDRPAILGYIVVGRFAGCCVNPDTGELYEARGDAIVFPTRRAAKRFVAAKVKARQDARRAERTGRIMPLSADEFTIARLRPWVDDVQPNPDAETADILAEVATWPPLFPNRVTGITTPAPESRE